MRGETTPVILRQFFRGHTRHQIAHDLACPVHRVMSILRRRHLKESHDIFIPHRTKQRMPDQSYWDFFRVIDPDFDEIET